MFVRYAKEDFDSDDWERKRTVIKRLGVDLKLSGRTIQFTPIKYLVPIEKQYPELRRQFELTRTDSQQRKNDPLRTVFSQWCPRQDLNLHALLHMLLRHTCIPVSPLGRGSIISYSQINSKKRGSPVHIIFAQDEAVLGLFLETS